MYVLVIILLLGVPQPWGLLQHVWFSQVHCPYTDLHAVASSLHQAARALIRISLSLLPFPVKVFFKMLFIDLKGGASICCSTYLFIHGLLFVCALTRDQTRSLGILHC